MPIRLNDLESQRFGIRAAKLVDVDASVTDIDAAAQTAGVDMVTARVDVTDLPRVHALEGVGFRLMDTLVYYSRDLNGHPVDLPARSDLVLRPAHDDDSDAVADIAQNAFTGYFGHYHADPRLENASADAAYAEWAENSVRSTSERAPSLLAVDGDKIVGFLTMLLDDSGDVELVLSGVDNRAQGRGVYSALIAGGISFANETGASRVFSSTQINNYAVQQVWSRFGMRHVRSLYTFHKWYHP